MPLLLMALVGAAAGQTWFTAGRFIAGGDTAPFLLGGHRGEYSWLWNHALSGAGSPSYDIASAPLVWITSVVEFLGGSDVLAQRLVVTGLYVAVGLASASFAGAITDRRGVAAASGLVGMFNPILLIYVPSIPILACISLFGWSGGFVLRAAQGRPARPWVFAAVTTGTVLLAPNPALFAMLAAWLVIVIAMSWAIGGRMACIRAGLFLLRAAPVAIVLNAWWVVPWVQTFTTAAGSARTAQTNVQAWSWTHARSSVSNVLTMTSSWTWAHREYVPWQPRIDSPYWAWLRFGLPVMGLAAPLVSTGRRRRVSLVLGATVAVSVFVGKGLHPPLSGVNLWMYDHVPGLWLLREPAGKVGLVEVMAFVALTALTMGALADRRRASVRPSRRAVLLVAPVAGLVAAVAYPFPLWTGAVVPDRRPGLPSAHVAVPAAWREAATFLNASAHDGKILVLPLDDIYQMPTTWGYYGVDSVPGDLLRPPVIGHTPGGYFGNADGFDDLVVGVQDALVSGDIVAVPRLLQALAVTHVVLRHDLDTTYPGRSFVDPERLAPAVRNVAGLRLTRSFGFLDVFQVDGATDRTVSAYQALRQLPPGQGSIEAVLGTMGPDEALAADAKDTDGGLRWLTDSVPASTSFDMRKAGPVEVSLGPSGDARLVRSETPAGAVLVVVPAGTVSIDGAPVPPAPQAVYPLPSEDVGFVAVGGSLHDLRGLDASLPAGDPRRMVVFSSNAQDVLGQFGPVEDCHRVNGASPVENGLFAAGLPDEPQPAVHLEAPVASACVAAPVTRFVSGTAYRVSFEYRSLTGASPRACVWQESVRRCAVAAALSAQREWAPYSTILLPDEGATGLRLFLYADGPDEPGRTATEYRSVRVGALTPTVVTSAVAGTSAPTRVSLPAGRHMVTLSGATPGSALRPFTALSDCNRKDERTAEEAGLGLRSIEGPEGDVIELRSLAHSACVTAPVSEVRPGADYRVQLDYRTVRGSPARICLWQEGPSRCATMPALVESTEWHHLDTRVALDPTTVGAGLYLYADDPNGRETITQYRGLSVGSSSAFTVAIRPSAEVSALPALRAHREGPARYDIRVAPSSVPFVLGLAESYAPGWRLRGLPEGASAEHVMIDGYANGWRVTGRLPSAGLKLQAVYEPEAVAHFALLASAVGAAALVLFALGAGLRTRRRRARPGESRHPGSSTGARAPLPTRVAPTTATSPAVRARAEEGSVSRTARPARVVIWLLVVACAAATGVGRPSSRPIVRFRRRFQRRPL